MNFVKVINNYPHPSPQIEIYSVDTQWARTQSYNIEIECDDFYKGPVMPRDDPMFTLYVVCYVVNSVSMDSASIASFNYDGTTQNIPFPAYSALPCANVGVTYSLQMQDASAVPSWASIDTNNKEFIVDSSATIPIGVYPFKLVVTDDAAGAMSNEDCQWTIHVSCVTSIAVTSNTIPALISYIVDTGSL